jgi:hypothetical protein
MQRPSPQSASVVQVAEAQLPTGSPQLQTLSAPHSSSVTQPYWQLHWTIWS